MIITEGALHVQTILAADTIPFLAALATDIAMAVQNGCIMI